MTANDIREQKFTRIRRTGYRKDEVDDFLREMTDHYAQLQEQTSDAQSEAARLRVLVHDLQLEAERLRRENEEPRGGQAPPEPAPAQEAPQSTELAQMRAEMQLLRTQLASLSAAGIGDDAQKTAAAGGGGTAAEEGGSEPSGPWEERRQQAFCLRDESFKDNKAIHAWMDVAAYASEQRQQLDQYAASSLAAAANQLERGRALVQECDKQLLQMQKIRKSVRELMVSMAQMAQDFREEASQFTAQVEDKDEQTPDPMEAEMETAAPKKRAAKKKPAASKKTKAEKPAVEEGVEMEI